MHQGSMKQLAGTASFILCLILCTHSYSFILATNRLPLGLHSRELEQFQVVAPKELEGQDLEPPHLIKVTGKLIKEISSSSVI